VPGRLRITLYLIAAYLAVFGILFAFAPTIQVYRPTGRLQVGTSTADLKHVKK
jgi:hypothetical protein